MNIIYRVGQKINFNKIAFAFSRNADPYYILGVEKTTPFNEIKLAFYKLANEFHPDKNDSKQAHQKFVIFKQAFENIKMEKGLMKPQNLYSSDDRQSMRPNPQKYTMDDEQGQKNFRDYTVQSQKADNEEYMRFKTSFQTISNINDIKIKVEQGDMPDPTQRFGLQKLKGKISSYSQSGNKYFFIIVTGLTFFTILTNQIYSRKEIQAKEGALKKMTQIQKRKTIESDLLQNRKMDIRNLQSLPNIKNIKNKQRIRDIQQGRGNALLKDKVINPDQMQRV